MKKLFKINQETTATHFALLLARIGIGSLMLTHGLPKMDKLFAGEPIQFLPLFGMSPQISLGLAVFAEVICSVLLIVGLATRFAAIPLIITMVVALTVVHAADPLGKQEPAFLFLIVYLVLLLAGAGKYSFDALLSKRTDNLKNNS